MKPRATENHKLRALRQQDQSPSRDFFTVTVPNLTNDSVYLLEIRYSYKLKLYVWNNQFKQISKKPWSEQISLQSFISSVQLLSQVWLFVTPWTAAHQAFLSITNSRSPPKPMSIESVMPSHPPSSPSPPALNLSQHQVSSSHQVDKVLEFQLLHHSFQWIPRSDLL